jgi:hypothetical protein
LLDRWRPEGEEGAAGHDGKARRRNAEHLPWRLRDLDDGGSVYGLGIWRGRHRAPDQASQRLRRL